MTIEEMEQEISEIPKFGAKASLDNLKKYLEFFDHPEKSLRVIHVAGTNGKGSVCAFIEAILRKAGYKTALFTSPHLVHMNERFRINFQVCEDQELILAWEQVKKAMQDEKEEKKEREPLTYFEILFLMSLLIFSRKDVDYCIMETGLGGRLDATVLTNPIISVITSISFDHTALLGNTIEEIAAEKAGIIKEGVPVVVLDENNGAFPVIRQKAERKHSHIYRVRSEKIIILKKTVNKIDFSINSSYYKDSHVSIKNTGDYQIYNATLAVIAVKVLFPEMERQILQEGLLQMHWEGRMEEICPGVYLDGAHNPGAIQQICQTVISSGGKWKLLFAVCADKDYINMVHMLGTIPWQKVYVTGLEEKRGANVKKIGEIFETCTQCPVDQYRSAKTAFFSALHEKKKEEHLLCLGSLYLVGEIKRWRTYILESEDKYD